MTSPEGRRDRAQPVRLELRRRDAGTLLGALAWVLGSLEIMRDRAAALEDADEVLRAFQTVSPRIERLIEDLSTARERTMTRPEFEQQVEDAYTDVRHAFEQWIQVTALDTLTTAVAQRLEAEGLSPDDLGGLEIPGDESPTDKPPAG